MSTPWKELTQPLAALAEHYDARSCWPQRSLDLVAAAGGWRWIIPEKYGGAQLGSAELLEAYEAVARGCLATALILTQRDGACDLIARGENQRLKERLLPAYARAERFTSIGIAQLTTSKSGGKTALRATPDGNDFLLDGYMPWVTGALQCDEIVTGAVLPDGKQLIACVSCDAPAVVVEPAMHLMALEASCTSRVRCKAVRITPDNVINGPADSGLSMRTPVKPLVVSAVGIGLAGALHAALTERPQDIDKALRQVVAPLERVYAHTRQRIFDAAASLDDHTADMRANEIRVAVNNLVTRLAIAYLTASRGTGYAKPHAAERLLREAMFFHVWSVTPEVQVATLKGIVGV